MLKNLKKIFAGIMAVSIMAAGITAFVPNAQYANAEDYTISNGAGSAKTDDQQSDLFGSDGLFTKIINAALYLIGAISVLMLIYGGVRYTISAGNANAVTAAKNTILYAIVGIVISLLAYAIVNWVLGALGAGGQ